MSHTRHITDFDPTTEVVETEAHIHVRINWECEDEQGHSHSLLGAEMELQIKYVDQPWKTLGVVPYDVDDVLVPIATDGWIETRQRQRFAGGRWQAWSDPIGEEVNLQPATKPETPRVTVMGSDGKHTTVQVDFNWSDRDVQGNTIKPVQMKIQALRPCADHDAWETLAVVRYADHHGFIKVPVADGVATWRVRVIQLNICEIESEPSDAVAFDIMDAVPKTSGSQEIEKGCL